jgi:hypothetical protein
VRTENGAVAVQALIKPEPKLREKEEKRREPVG